MVTSFVVLAKAPVSRGRLRRAFLSPWSLSPPHWGLGLSTPSSDCDSGSSSKEFFCTSRLFGRITWVFVQELFFPRLDQNVSVSGVGDLAVTRQDFVNELIQLTHQCERALEHGLTFADGSCQTEAFYLEGIRPE